MPKLWIMLAFGLGFLTAANAKDPWVHIEYGAANVESGSTVIGPGAPLRLEVAEARLDKLAESNQRVIFYVNDLNAEMTERAGNALLAYATKQGYRNVEIRALPGNFLTMDLPVTDSAALNNPPGEIFDSGEHTLTVFQRLADQSRNGLEIISSVKTLASIAATVPNVKDLGEAPSYLRPDGTRVAKPGRLYRFENKKDLSHSRSNSDLGKACPIVFRKIIEP